MGQISDILNPEFMQEFHKRELIRLLKSSHNLNNNPTPQGEPPKWQYLGTNSMSSFEEGRLEGYSDASKIYESIIEKLEERIRELEKG